MTDHTVRQRALEWVKLNPEVWSKHFEIPALYEAAHGRRVSVQRFIEDARRLDYVNRAGDPCKINNSFAAIFARLLIEQHPELSEFIETRRSVYDDIEV